MSFMIVSGKTFICQICENSLRVEYEGGPLMTQIGDFEVMQQQDIARELGDQNENDGFYLYDFGICASCYEKEVDKSLKEKSVQINELLTKLNNLSALLEEAFVKTLPKVESSITWNKIVEDFNLADDILVDNRQNKGKRNTPLKKFIRNYSDDLESYIIKKVLKTPELESLVKHYKEQFKLIMSNIDKLIKKNNLLYFGKMTNDAENLNPYILTDTSVRTPIDESPSEMFYYKSQLDIELVREQYSFRENNFYLSNGFISKMIKRVVEEQNV